MTICRFTEIKCKVKQFIRYYINNVKKNTHFEQKCAVLCGFAVIRFYGFTDVRF